MKRIYTLIVATLMAAMVVAGPALACGVGVGERPPSNSSETGMVARPKPPGNVRRVQKSERPKVLGNGGEIIWKVTGGFRKVASERGLDGSGEIAGCGLPDGN
jgi:hypothetical protein